MAPSVRGISSRVSKRQASVRTNAKISKAATTHPAVKKELDSAFKPVVVVSKKPPTQAAKNPAKRKRNEVGDDSETEPDDSKLTTVSAKKVCDFTKDGAHVLTLL